MACVNSRLQVLLDASQKLEALNQQLARSNRLKDEFLSTLTHGAHADERCDRLAGADANRVVDDDLTQYQQTAAGSAWT